MGVLQWVAVGIAGWLLTAVLTALFQDQITEILARIVTRVRVPGRDVAGKWETYWGVVAEPGSSPTAREISNVIITFDLKRFRDQVTGRDLNNASSQVKATLIDTTFMTGTWKDNSGERYQWGAFQLHWDGEGNGLIGKFTGKDSRNHINHGIWLWARRDADLPNLAREAKRLGYKFDMEAFVAGIEAALAARASR
ncbi:MULTISPECIES: hypothetical protein [unclassified Streptomyces]|uniref:hypothetical protein n=1 Tax=unclassified Streptomyces TaxID=2593676 RepID=UPI00235B3922|nr:hypothetical protein [Streptomyces sp. TUS-ST3]GLP67357.1 hypothetical protein TUSST3_39790 [Streptomyces sp. TUS-ST3]